MPKPTKLKPFRAIYQHVYAQDRKRKVPAFLTYSGRTDGLGAQLHSYYSLHAYAALRGLRIIPQALRNVAHNDGNDPEWDQKWNTFFNLPTEATPIEFPAIRIQPETLWRIRANTVYTAKKAHAVTDLFPDTYTQVIPALRDAYDTAPVQKTSLFESNAQRKVAFHLRFGDASGHSTRASSIEAAVHTLKQLIATLERSKESYEIVVLSQGEHKRFLELEEAGARLELDSDLFSTFHTMVTADILIMAKSSLSYCAGLLNLNTVLYTPFWHPPLKQWYTNLNQFI